MTLEVVSKPAQGAPGRLNWRPLERPMNGFETTSRTQRGSGSVVMGQHALTSLPCESGAPVAKAGAKSGHT